MCTGDCCLNYFAEQHDSICTKTMVQHTVMNVLILVTTNCQYICDNDVTLHKFVWRQIVDSVCT